MQQKKINIALLIKPLNILNLILNRKANVTLSGKILEKSWRNLNRES